MAAKKKISLSTYAQILKFLLLLIGVPFVIVPFFYIWFWDGASTFNKIKLGVMASSGMNLAGANLAPSPILQFLATFVDSISVILFLLGCFYCIKLLSHFSRGELFSESILVLFKKIVNIAFFWTLYNPLKSTLLSTITTLNNTPGQRILSVSLRGEDIIHILVVGSLLVVNSLMQEAYRLKQEQDLTV